MTIPRYLDILRSQANTQKIRASIAQLWLMLFHMIYFVLFEVIAVRKIEALAVEEYGPITKLSLELALKTKWTTLQAMG